VRSVSAKVLTSSVGMSRSSSATLALTGHLPRAPSELVFGVASGLTLSWTIRQGGTEDVEINLRHAQVDCELVPCTHPVILRRSRAGPDPLLHARIRLTRPAAATAITAPVVIDEASFRSQQLELCLEMHLLAAFAHLCDDLADGSNGQLADLSNATSTQPHALSVQRHCPVPHLLLELERLRRSGAIDGAIYIENLSIASLRLNLTVQLDINPHGDSLHAPLRRWLLEAFGKSGVSEQRAPLRVPAFRITNRLLRPQALLDALGRHFGRGLSDEIIYKLIAVAGYRQALGSLSRHSYILPLPRALSPPDPPTRIIRDR
jgi:hypothetical protein